MLCILLSVQLNTRVTCLQEVISTPYIVFTKAKLFIGLLQGEERKLHQKILKKISKVESAKTEEISHHAWGVQNFRTPEGGVRNSHTIRTPFAHLEQLSSEGHIFLVSAPNHTRFEALDS